jgi:hypothetical protein
MMWSLRCIAHDGEELPARIRAEGERSVRWQASEGAVEPCGRG